MRFVSPFMPIAVMLCFFVAFSQSLHAEVALETLFKNPKFGSATLSPNGKFLAATTNINGRLQLAVVDVETGAAKNIAGYEDLDVDDINWIDNERIAFDVIDREGEYNSSAEGLFVIHRDGGRTVELSKLPREMNASVGVPQGALALRIVSRTLDDPNTVIALGYHYNNDVQPFRVNTRTGSRKEIVVDVPGLPRGFVFDRKNQLRVAITANANHSNVKLWYRAESNSAWKMLAEYPAFDSPFSVLGFDADGTTMFVSAPTPEGMRGIYQFDFAANKPGVLLASDKSVDVSRGLVLHPDTGKLLGVRMATEPPRTLWFDAGLKALQAGIDKANPGLVNVIQPSSGQSPMLISSYSSMQPTRYSLYHPDKKKLQNLFAERPWVEVAKMSPQLAYDYVARDGLPILAYLTLPQGKSPKALPLIVNVHGGPWARDHWGFDPEVQFLAGMGYAVLQPQFRGSTGFGAAHFKKSFGQWGLAMQDDITDGVNSLIKQGVVDPKRVCIMGASYGGYAAMMGIVKDPDLYRCAVNLLGVTDINYLWKQSAWRIDRVADFDLKTMVGDPDKLAEQFIATSPLKQVAKIKVPVFMAYGENDKRVPLVHGREMRDALQRHQKVYEYIELEKEEHGFAKEETRLRVYGAIANFLKKHNPPN